MPLPLALSAISASPAPREVQAGGLTWTLRRLGPCALFEAAIPGILMPAIDVGIPPAPAPSPTADRLRARIEGREILVCQAVVACEGEAVRLVRTPEEEDRDATPPRLWVGALPVAVFRELADAADGQDQEVADAIGRAFPSGSVPGAAPGPDRPEVRVEAVEPAPGGGSGSGD